jgi:DNA relaxase NicK
MDMEMDDLDRMDYRLSKLGSEWLRFDLRFKNYEDAYQDFKGYFFEIYPFYEDIYDDEDGDFWEEERLDIMDGIDVVLEPKYGCLRN